MTALIVLAALILIFAIAIISPHVAGKIERKTDREATRLKRLSNWLWDPLTWWSKQTIKTTNKLINKSAEGGKETRRKL